MPSPHLSDPVAFNGRRIFLTGGTGFVGRSLLDYFAECAARHGGDFEVVALSRDPESFLDRFPLYAGHSWLRLVGGDLTALPECGSFSDLIHAAADTHRAGDEIGWFDQLVTGTARVLDFAARTGVSRSLLVSSGAVYGGARAGNRPDESDAITGPALDDVRSVYGQGKRAAEHLCALYNARHDIGCVIARCFAILSPHMPLDGPYAAGNFIRDALSPEVQAIQINGNPDTVRSYISGRDMAHWLCVLLTRGVAGQAYNVGSDQAVSIRELALTILSVLRSNKDVEVAADARTRPSSTYVPAIGKAAALGLRNEITLEDAIEQAARASSLMLQRASAG